MKSRIFLIVVLITLMFPAVAFSQSRGQALSRADSIQVYAYTLRYADSTVCPRGSWLDTAFFAAQKYDPLFRGDAFYQSLGNIGLAHQPINLTTKTSTGFDDGYHHMDAYRLSANTVRFFSSLRPFTDLAYAMGSRKEQTFRVIHSHTIKKQVTLGAYFNIINALGHSSFRQKSDEINTYFTGHFTTRNRRYQAFAYYSYNRLKTMENGGILVDSIYEQAREGRNITQFSYGLKSALNRLTENTWCLKHVLNADFRKFDSTSARNRGVSLGQLSLTTTFTKPRYLYMDEGLEADYYPFFYGADSATVKDSMFIKNLENSLNWASNERSATNRPATFRFFAGLRHKYIEVHEQPQTSFLSYLTPSAGFNLRLHPLLTLSASGEYVLGNAFNNDLHGMASIALRPGSAPASGLLTFSARFSSTDFPWVARHSWSSYHRWDNDFAKQQQLSLKLGYERSRLSTWVQWTSLKNFLYWDVFSNPQQYKDPAISVVSLFVKKTFVFGKFAIDNRAIMQYSTNANILHLPLFTATQSYLVTFAMFKKALGVQTGIDLWYNTPYYADAWNPDTRQFHLQYEKKTGNYLYIDVFLNLKIKRAILFLKLDHANAGLFGYNYYSTPHYPAADRAFKFGVSWLFHD